MRYINSQKAITFLYHDVTNDPYSSGFVRKGAFPYKHSEHEFRANLLAIEGCGRLKVSILDQTFGDGDQIPIMITFDDGGRSFMVVADEIEKFGWKGHFFITTSFIDSPTFLSTSQIIELHSRGHIIGTHSHTHPDIFRSLPYEMMMSEWCVSRAILSDILGQEILSGSVPGGDINSETIRSASESGLKYLFTSEPVISTWSYGDMKCFGRICPKSGTSIKKVESYAAGKSFYRAWMLRRTKNLARTIFLPLYKVYTKRNVENDHTPRVNR